MFQTKLRGPAVIGTVGQSMGWSQTVAAPFQVLGIEAADVGARTDAGAARGVREHTHEAVAGGGLDARREERPPHTDIARHRSARDPGLVMAPQNQLRAGGSCTSPCANAPWQNARARTASSLEVNRFS